MEVVYRMVVILFLATWLVSAYGCEESDVAVYKVTVRTLWSEETFPKDYPSNRPKAQWSPVFGQSHNNSYALYRIGEVARPSVRDFAQFGKLDTLVEQGDDEPKVYDQFSSPAIGSGSGVTDNMVFVSGTHNLVSLICRIIPSPDWFIGIDSLDLCVDSSWVEQITLDLEPLDAGAASGLTFTAPRWETTPPEPVSHHGPRQPNHPAAGFYYPFLKDLPAIAKVEFSKIKQYSTKELNNMARKEIITKMKEKDERKRKINSKYLDEYYHQEITTKNYIEQLKDIEEDPVGTPRPNNPDNTVVVVTKPPTTTTTTTEAEFDSELKNMDEVVLAVARGRRLGLGKHLPRHFRSRLHHAVNKIQPNDCLVSEWGEWSPCSVTCGFGEKFRQRTIIREKKRHGRECPRLVERQHCGNVNSCFNVDYFDW